jgi:hypothetical protein
MVRWKAETIGRLLGHPHRPAATRPRRPRPGWRLPARDVTTVSAHLLRGAFGNDLLLSDADAEPLATTA